MARLAHPTLRPDTTSYPSSVRQQGTMTDVSIDEDELVLLSMVWCVALKIDIGEAGVLVQPADVKGFLQKAFVTERAKWHGPRLAICAEFDIPDLREDPYKHMLAARGPAFMSIRKVINRLSPQLLPSSNDYPSNALHCGYRSAIPPATTTSGCPPRAHGRPRSTRGSRLSGPPRSR